jgi:hypothetical protein
MNKNFVVENTDYDVEEKIISLAWENEQFREALLNNPAEALRNELGLTIPENIKIKLLEEASDTVYFILPQKPSFLNDENDEIIQVMEMGMGSYGECKSWGCDTGGHDC